MFLAASIIIFPLLALLPPVFAVPQNSTIDDQDFSKITYVNPMDWDHSPLTGWEDHFYNGSRSYTWTPGATASFTFTGYGIWLQGPYAPDQARRRVFLDGVDMGAFDALAVERIPSKPFWGTRFLEYTTHTVVVAHNDTPQTIFAMDAWIVEYDFDRTPLPYSTTTTTETAPTPTITITNGPLGENGTIAGNPNSSSGDSPKSYNAIIIGVVVPVVLFLALCICAFCMYRSRKTRSAKRRRESFAEKLFRRQPLLQSPLTPGFGNQAGGTDIANGAAGAAAGGIWTRRRRDSEDPRAMSPHTFASTRYSTALDHMYEMEQDVNQGQTSPATPAMTAASNVTHDLLDVNSPSAAAMYANSSTHGSSFGGSATGAAAASPIVRHTPISATFEPPAEWQTTPSFAVPGALNSPSHSSDGVHHTAASFGAGAAAGGTLISGTPSRGLRSTSQAGTTEVYNNMNNKINVGRLGTTPKPSTVFSAETDSGMSYAGPPSRYYQHQPDVPVRDRDMSDNAVGAGAAPLVTNAHRNSVLRRWSAALTSSLPFNRNGSRPNSNSHAMSGTNTGYHQNTDLRSGHDAMRNIGEDDLEGNRRYSRGMNHINLGIRLNYNPTATATAGFNSPPHGPLTLSPSPVRSSTMQTGTRARQQSQNANFDDVRHGSDGVGGGGSSNGDTFRSTPVPTTPGSALVMSPFDDLAFSSYTRHTRERVLSRSIPGDVVDDSGAGADAAMAPKAAVPSQGSDTSGGDVIEPEEKEEKIMENLDGDTIHEGNDEDGRWSAGHGTLASQGRGDGVSRRGSAVSRQRSIRSNTDRQVVPPPYSVYIPPDTKTMPPP
ncbi:hypothetical protein M408DRAFT_10361 [Serendipita vermifera MAFF 305830]|uniref:Uncharacterized protein n=1 Tax=Serendipita vermifera MAFF 305830 TaxID=933852 RepID=A0A0C3ALR5_SERVB|nr:hypothetical protein M408DRAFT_10361 [Serendipita vermifera MAFF 305830]